MISITSAPLFIKAKAALHLVLRSEMKTTAFKQALDAVQADTMQVAILGETILTEARFEHFDVVVLHNCEHSHIKDLLKKVKAQYLQRFKKMLMTKSRKLFIYGNAMRILSSKITILDAAKPLIMNKTYTSTSIDIQTPGLGMCDTRFIYPYSVIKEKNNFVRILSNLARESPVIVFDGSAVMTLIGDQITVKYGTLYMPKDGKLIPLMDSPQLFMTPTQKHEMQQDTENRADVSVQDEMEEAHEEDNKKDEPKN